MYSQQIQSMVCQSWLIWQLLLTGQKNTEWWLAALNDRRSVKLDTNCQSPANTNRMSFSPGWQQLSTLFLVGGVETFFSLRKISIFIFSAYITLISRTNLSSAHILPPPDKPVYSPGFGSHYLSVGWAHLIPPIGCWYSRRRKTDPLQSNTLSSDVLLLLLL